MGKSRTSGKAKIINKTDVCIDYNVVEIIFLFVGFILLLIVIMKACRIINDV